MLKLATVLLAVTGYVVAQAPSEPAKPLPPGPMQPKIKAACTNCHNTSRLWEHHFTRMQWSDELDKMVGLGAVVPDDDRKPFLDYLTKNFGPAKGAKTDSKPAAK